MYQRIYNGVLKLDPNIQIKIQEIQHSDVNKFRLYPTRESPGIKKERAREVKKKKDIEIRNKSPLKSTSRTQLAAHKSPSPQKRLNKSISSG